MLFTIRKIEQSMNYKTSQCYFFYVAFMLPIIHFWMNLLSLCALTCKYKGSSLNKSIVNEMKNASFSTVLLLNQCIVGYKSLAQYYVSNSATPWCQNFLLTLLKWLHWPTWYEKLLKTCMQTLSAETERIHCTKREVGRHWESDARCTFAFV